jgi:hypothetical protein
MALMSSQNDSSQPRSNTNILDVLKTIRKDLECSVYRGLLSETY